MRSGVLAEFWKMQRQKWWKIFGLPSPKDLGWSDSNALPMDMFKSGNDKSHTWEDWERKMREEYPVRYFLSETLPFTLRVKVGTPIKDAWYWLKCHMVPSYKYHLLDLRQPKRDGELGYRYGWIDSDTQILYALFNILNNFVKHELPNFYCPSEEEVQNDPHLLHQRHVYLEAKAIHYWWNVERARQIKNHTKLLHDWSEAKKNHDANEHSLWADLGKAEVAMDAKEDEMIARLMKIRRFLWT